MKLPNLPTPHDCIIESISFDDEYLIFNFEKNIARHDSIVFELLITKVLRFLLHRLRILHLHRRNFL